MTLPRSNTSRIRMLALLALAASALSACTPQPEPTPTPTAAFASEEEAFAAAEEVYRAYNDALSQVDASDSSTFEPLFALTTGGVNEADRESFSAMHAQGYTISGATKILRFEGVSVSSDFEEINAQACLDVSAVTVKDSNGNSKVNPERADVYGLDLKFVQVDEAFLLSSAKAAQDASCVP